MARSVSYLNGAQHIAYKHLDQLFDHEADEFDWELLVEDISYQLIEKFPSLTECDRWEDEDHIILENGHCEIAISEYNGLVAISMRAIEEWDSVGNGLHQYWVDQAGPKFMELSSLVKRGTFSNGEAVFVTKNEPPVHYTSKEGRADWM